jgi:hypothetical protein
MSFAPWSTKAVMVGLLLVIFKYKLLEEEIEHAQQHKKPECHYPRVGQVCDA